MDNVLLASELIKGYNRAYNSPRCMVKVDIRKAYDSLKWSFLQKVMEELGFPNQYIQWVMVCVRTLSFSILVNGYPTPPFAAAKGLRQGSLQPYLFAIGMEYLTRRLAGLANKKNFKYHPKCQRLKITQLIFADDFLMFARGDVHSVLLLTSEFASFSEASGLHANPEKSCIYFSGVTDDVQSLILKETGMTKGDPPFRYLGVPLSSRKLNYSQCRPLVEKITARIHHWSVKSLSYAGRFQLLQSVIGGMMHFWAQLFCLPKKWIKQVLRICRIYLWTGKETPSRKASLAWEQVCLPKVCGGLNLRNMIIWNQAALLKLLWAISVKKDRLWIQWVHSYFIILIKILFGIVRFLRVCHGCLGKSWMADTWCSSGKDGKV